MDLIKAKYSDIDEIMEIIERAQEHFKNEGIDQWQNNYPNHEVIKEDIDNDNSYILKDGDKIVATTAVIFDGDPTYNTIYDGEWLSLGEYTVIHRMAVNFNRRGSGLASIFIKEIEKLSIDKEIYSIKVDTHRENIPMQRLLFKNAYKECGIVYLEDKGERIAFEKLLEK